jgi:hypothetical protein
VLVNACQKHAAAEIRQETKTVPRRPKSLFMGSVSQQPGQKWSVSPCESLPTLKHLTNNGTRHIRCRINKTQEPRIALTLGAYPKGNFVERLGAVHNGLIHTLDRRAKRAN